MELALLVGCFTRAGEIATRRIATDVVLLCAIAVSPTAAASAPTSPPAAAFASRSVLRPAIARLDRGRVVGEHGVSLGDRRRCNGSGIRIGGGLLLALAFALALTLGLPLRVALRIALTRLLVALALTWSLWGRVTIAGVFATATTAAALLAMPIASTGFLVTMTSFFVAVPVAPVCATIPVAVTSAVSFAMAVAAMTGPVAVTAIAVTITMAVAARFAACRRGFGRGSARSLAGE